MDNEFGKKMKEICLESFIASLKISEKFIESSLRKSAAKFGENEKKKERNKERDRDKKHNHLKVLQYKRKTLMIKNSSIRSSVKMNFMSQKDT